MIARLDESVEVPLAAKRRGGLSGGWSLKIRHARNLFTVIAGAL